MPPTLVDLIHNVHQGISASRLAGREQILRVLPPFPQIHQHYLCLAVGKARSVDAFQRTQRVPCQHPHIIGWIVWNDCGRIGVLWAVPMKRCLNADAQPTA